MKSTLVFLTFLLQLASAHFQIDYPYWRADSFEAPYSQYTYPCAGVNQSVSANNRTLWPLTGGSLELELHHAWTYVFVNLAVGNNVSSFNYSLTPQFLNTTGNGTLCLNKINLPAGLVPTEGTNASIQVVTSGASGSALYNCADITFSSSATVLSGDQCKTNGVTVTTVQQQVNGTLVSSGTTTTSNGSTSSSSGAASTSSKASAASGELLDKHSIALTSAFAGIIAIAFSTLL